MKRLVVISLLLCCAACGDDDYELKVDVEIAGLRANSSAAARFVSKIERYEIKFSGAFGDRKFVVNRDGTSVRYRVLDIPYDSSLKIEVSAIGSGFEGGDKWATSKVLAVGATPSPINWNEHFKDVVRIECNLTEDYGVPTYEKLENDPNS